jgi:hypothetical protein
VHTGVWVGRPKGRWGDNISMDDKGCYGLDECDSGGLL